MKKYLLLFFLTLGLSVSAQPWDGGYPPVGEDPDARAGIYPGNYRTYPFKEITPAPLPGRYHPVYISHYGRHGSRYYTSEEGYARIWRLFTEAEAAGALTSDGQAFLDTFRPLYEQRIRGHAGQLTAIGEREQALLAANMTRRYPQVFRPGAEIDARSTTKPRVIASMDAFCTTLRTLCPGLSVETAARPEDMRILHCIVPENPDVRDFDLHNLDLKGRWKDDYLAMRAQMDTSLFFSRMFTRPVVKHGSARQDVLQIFYNICADGPCIDPMFRGLDWLTDREIEPIWRFTNLKFYAIAGPSRKYSRGRAPALMHPLLDDFVRRAEEDLAAERPAVRLRFGHDYQLVSLLALLGSPAWSGVTDDPAEVENIFRYNNIPMASNLQLVFWQGRRKDDLLVRILFNDEDLPLPLKPVRKVYYRWDHLKAYLDGRIAAARKLLKETEER